MGRDSANSIVLYSNVVSRQQAILLRMTTPKTARYLFRIIDGNLQGKRSTNGLSVNGKRCFSHNLRHGDVVVFSGDVKATYYASSDLANTERLTVCKAEDLSGLLSNLSDPFGTLIESSSGLENSSEAALVRLASFPELSSNPILEIDLAGTITYLNPAAVVQFPDIRAAKLQHPILARLVSAVRGNQEKFFVREVEVGHKVFEQSVHWISESDLIRSYLVDITEHKRVEAALRQAEEKYRGIFENAVEGIFQTTPSGRYLTANPMLARIYGYKSPEELVTHVTDIERQLYVEPNRRNEFLHLVHRGDVWDFQSQVYRKDREVIWIAENARATYNPGGQLLGYEGTVVDITVAKRLEAERQRSQAELHKRDSLLQGVAKATNYLLSDNDYEAAIAKVLRTLGEAAGVDRVFIGENHPHSLSGETAMSIRFEWTQAVPKFNATGWQNQPYSKGLMRWYNTLRVGKSVSGMTQEFPEPERQILEPTGVLATLIVPILVEDQFWGYIGFDDCHATRQWSNSEESILFAMVTSISGALQRQQTEETIRYQALHDLLTGLPNRILFGDRLTISLLNARRSSKILAVMFLDLDRFKTINDSLGHTVGDQLLQRVTERLTGCLREGDTVARWGGDEFTLLLPQISCPKDAAKSAQRVVEALKPPFNLDGHELYITSSVGIALYPYAGEDSQTLLKSADGALYRAKELGRNNYQFYSAALNAKASELLTLESRLHQALERQELLVYYQPQVNITTGEVIGMEALVRWQHPEIGMISPATFVPIAEKNGLIIPIGKWVLRTACAQNKAWQDQGLAPLSVAVNISVRQFQQSDLVETVIGILAETGLEPCFLELEITESIAMLDVEFTYGMLRNLQRLGIRIALDDFGTGYSSLSYLKKFPFDVIKIDQSFVRDLSADSKDMAVITAAIAIGRQLKLSVVAEGVETEAQLNFLRSLHCEEGQGYFFSQPLSSDGATKLLQAEQLKDLRDIV